MQDGNNQGREEGVIHEREYKLINDIVSGVTVGMLAIPQSLSYAGIAGIPLHYGLFSDIQILYPIFGGSNYLIIGPVAVMSIVSHRAVTSLGNFDNETFVEVTCLFCLLVGITQILLGLSGIGKLISRLLSDNIVFAFTQAAALLIGSTQIQGLLSPTISKESSDLIPSGRLLHQQYSSWFHFALVTLNFTLLYMIKKGKVIFLKKLFGNNSRNLGPCLVLFTGILLNYLTEAFIPIKAIPQGLPYPSLKRIENLGDLLLMVTNSPQRVFSLISSTFLLSMLGFSEAWSISKAYENIDNNMLNESRELCVLGLCNGLTFLIGGYCVTGSFSRTAVNVSAGAVSSLSAFICCILVVFVLIWFTKPLMFMPKASVSCIVVAAVLSIVDMDRCKLLLVRHNRDTVIFIIVLLFSFIFGVDYGLLSGIILEQAFGVI